MLSPLIRQTIAAITPADMNAIHNMQHKLDGLLKPSGSLGRLEQLAMQLAGISATTELNYKQKAILVFAADHGVFNEGVAITPQNVTAIQAENMTKGLTGVCALAQVSGSQVIVTDVGINADPIPETHQYKIRRGTANIAHGPAMTHEQAVKAIEVGIVTAQRTIDHGIQLIGVGEIGIANTTAAAAIISVLCQKEAELIVGLGANLPIDKRQHKVNVVNTAIQINQAVPENPIDVLAKLGGLELGAMCGAMLAAAALKIPVVLDGFLSYAAALLACRLCPQIDAYLIPSHFSAEQGAKIALDALGLRPYLDMEMRLGEGSGAALLFPIIDAACAMGQYMGKLTDSNIVLPNA